MLDIYGGGLMLNWLERMCLAAANRRIALGVITTFAGLLIVAGNYRYAWNFLAGPFSTAADELDKVSDPDRAEDFFIRVTGSKIVDTGIQQVTTTTNNGAKESERVTAEYFALLVGGVSVIAIFQQLHPTARVDQGLDSFRPAFGILSAIAS